MTAASNASTTRSMALQRKRKAKSISAKAEMLFLQIKLHDAAVWELEGGVVGVFDI